MPIRNMKSVPSANATASIAKVSVRLVRAISRPPIAGPTVLAMLPSVWVSASAAGSRSRPTSAGTEADRAGLSIAEMPALSPLRTKIAQTAGSSSEALNASPIAVTMRPSCAMTRRRRRSTESTMAPPTTDVASSGTSCAIPSAPTRNVDSVS